MRFIPFLLFATIFSTSTFSTVTGAGLQWIPAGDSVKIDMLNLGLEPAGVEGSSYLYVARVHPDSGNARRVPGKLKVDYRFITTITDEGVRDFNRFEVLVSPPGTTSWLASSFTDLPENAIVGGELPDGTLAYVCRALHNGGNVIVGKYFSSEGYCKYVFEAGEYMATSFEILTVNRYGLKVGVNPAG